jgi:hypothetical protein
MEKAEDDKKQKYEKNLVVALMLNRQFAEMIGDKRLATCGRAFTLQCATCKAFAICKKHLRVSWYCGRRYCMVCQKLACKLLTQEISVATINLIQQYEALGKPIIPCVLTLTVMRKPNLPLRALLLTMSEAWERLRRGGEKKEWLQNKRHGIEPWWRQYFVGETFSCEFLFEAGKGWHPHLHALCLRYYHKKAHLGTHPWTGAVTERPGIRTLWHQYLKDCWQKQYALGNLPEPFPCHYVENRHIEKAKYFINNAHLQTFEDMKQEGTLSEEQQQHLAICQQTTDVQERQSHLKTIKALELQKLESERKQLLGREIGTIINIKALYTKIKDLSQERQVPISVYFDKRYGKYNQ